MYLTQLNPKTYIRNLLSFSIHSNLAHVPLALVGHEQLDIRKWQRIQ